jgi:short-subunit dehydrogenase
MQLGVAGMLERGGGFVVNVASMAGRVPLKGCVFYGAAKAGLAMASEIARGELGRRGVRVVTVYPGPVASALERGARAQYGDGALARAVPAGRPDQLARRILDAVERGRARVIYPTLYGLGWLATNTAARFALAAGPDPAA